MKRQTRLHPAAWALATDGLTKIADSVNPDEDSLVKPDLTKVNWAETHLREIVQKLPAEDHATYRTRHAVTFAHSEIGLYSLRATHGGGLEAGTWT